MASLGAIFGIVPECSGAVCKGYLNLQAEIPVIRQAAERNGIRFGSDDWFILLAIRKAENGRTGCEFGVKHQKARETNLDIQAGWAAATIVKNRYRWIASGRQGKFIDFLADRYCPTKDDLEGNENWKVNVKYFYNRFKDSHENTKTRRIKSDN